MAGKQKDDTPDVDGGGNSASVAGARLRALIERIERMEEEKKAVADDIKEIYVEAKGSGFDTKVMRMVVKRRKRSRDEIAEEEAILEMYENALLV